MLAQVRFIQDIIKGNLTVTNRKKVDILSELREKNFKEFSNDKKGRQVDDDDEESPAVSGSKGYDYLLGMKIWTLTAERVAALLLERDEWDQKLSALHAKLPHDIWEEDLCALEDALDVFEQDIRKSEDQEKLARHKAQNKKLTSGKGKGKKQKNDRASGTKKIAKFYDSEEDRSSEEDYTYHEPQKKKSKTKYQVDKDLEAESDKKSKRPRSADTFMKVSKTNVVTPHLKKAATKDNKVSAALSDYRKNLTDSMSLKFSKTGKPMAPEIPDYSATDKRKKAVASTSFNRPICLDLENSDDDDLFDDTELGPEIISVTAAKQTIRAQPPLDGNCDQTRGARSLRATSMTRKSYTVDSDNSEEDSDEEQSEDSR